MAIVSEMQNKVFEVRRHSGIDPRPHPLLSVIVTLPLWLATPKSWPLIVACQETAFVLFVWKGKALYHSRTILFSSRYIKKLLYFKHCLFFF